MTEMLLRAVAPEPSLTRTVPVAGSGSAVRIGVNHGIDAEVQAQSQFLRLKATNRAPERITMRIDDVTKPDW